MAFFSSLRTQFEKINQLIKPVEEQMLLSDESRRRLQDRTAPADIRMRQVDRTQRDFQRQVQPPTRSPFSIRSVKDKQPITSFNRIPIAEESRQQVDEPVLTTSGRGLLNTAKFAKVFQEEMSRSFVGAGLSILDKETLTDEEIAKRFGPEYVQTFKDVFGDRPLRDIRGIGEETLDIFGATKETAIRFGDIAGLVVAGLDFTPFGGGKKQIIKLLQQTDDVADSAKIWRRLGLPEELVIPYAERTATTKDVKIIKQALENANKVVETTKATSKIPTGLEPLAQEARKYRTAGEFAERIKDLVMKRKAGIELLDDQKAFLRALSDPSVRELKPSELFNKLRGVEKPKLNIPDVRYKDLDEIAEAIKKKDITDFELFEARSSLALLEEEVEAMSFGVFPVKGLRKYISKTTGRLPEVTGQKYMRSLTGSGKSVKNSEFGVRGDQIITEFGFKTPEEAQKALDTYITNKEKIEELKNAIRPLRKQVSAIKKGERLMQISRKDRRNAFHALKSTYNLTDLDISKIRGGRDLSLMSTSEFETFMHRAEDMAENIEAHRQARIQLEGTIHTKELRKWENVRDALKFPSSFSEMTVEQLNQLEEIFSQYKKGDEFLPTRMMETLPNTRLAGLRTIREVLEVLAREKGLTVEQVAKLKIDEFHKFMGDHMLSRQHPFFERLVFMKNKSFLEANARVIELSDNADKLVKQARKSRQRGFIERLIPTDKGTVKWLEADSVARMELAKGMTPEELRASQYMDSVFREYYDYLVKKHAEKKFSRFEDKYFPHVRRSFLEAWKEDGILSAFKESLSKFAQDQKYLDILNERTGEILPYEKWVGFTQYRTDKLIPTSNAAKAFESYVAVLEKARHLDALVPEIAAYVHALSPRKLSPRGLELDTSIKRFVNEWVNANKGRTPKGFFDPGGKMDWALRMSVTATRFIDLALNFTTQIAAPIGEQVMNLTMLKPVAYKTALLRLKTAQGRTIINKYENFVGRSFFKELSRASNTVGDNLMNSFFALFHGAVRKGNEVFLLGKMTDAEFKAGEISSERLAQLMVEMNKYRAVKGTESILGRTGEGIAFKQYKTWAIPILRATTTNALDLAKLLKKDGLKAFRSDEAKELFYSVGIGSAVGVGIYGYYTDLAENKNRTFLENIQYKAIRDGLSIIGALDPTLWSSIRVADFYEDLAKALTDLMLLEEYKTTGELKGPKEFFRTITPGVVKQFISGEDSKSSNEGLLPELPKLPKLPELPKLPKLPKLNLKKEERGIASEVIETVEDKLASIIGNTAQAANLVRGRLINNYDIKSYAIDPRHERKIASIYNRIGEIDDIDDIHFYIQSVAKDSPVSAEDVIDAAYEYDVDPKLMLALMQQDSHFGTTGKGARSNNPGNVGNDDTGRIVVFDSWRDGVFAVARNLAKRKRFSTNQFKESQFHEEIEEETGEPISKTILKKVTQPGGILRMVPQTVKAISNHYGVTTDWTNNLSRQAIKEFPFEELALEELKNVSFKESDLPASKKGLYKPRGFDVFDLARHIFDDETAGRIAEWKVSQKIDRPNVLIEKDLQQPVKEIISHETMHHFFSKKWNEEGGGFIKDFFEIWNEIQNKYPELEMIREDMRDRNYSRDILTVANEGYAFLGQKALLEGAEVIPLELRKFYKGVIKFQ